MPQHEWAGKYWRKEGGGRKTTYSGAWRMKVRGQGQHEKLSIIVRGGKKKKANKYLCVVGGGNSHLGWERVKRTGIQHGWVRIIRKRIRGETTILKVKRRLCDMSF